MNKALVIRTQGEEERKFVTSLLRKLGIETAILDPDLIEDHGLSMKMKEVDRTKMVGRKSIMRKLKLR